MNIKNRLKKIESGMELDSEFCRCDREIVIKVQPRDENGELPPEEPPEQCRDCGKEINRRHFTFNFTGNIEIDVIRPSYRVIEPGDEY